MVTDVRPGWSSRGRAGRYAAAALSLSAGRPERRAGPRRAASRSAAGSAVLIVLLLMLLFSAVAFGLSLVVRVELAVADRFVQAAEALYAAEGALAAALSELRVLGDWTPVLDGTGRSVHADGAFIGSKPVPLGGEVAICCGPASASGRLAADTAGSPLPARRVVQWQPFLWTPFESLAPADPPSRVYLVVWVADDEADDDADTTVDSNGVIIVRAEALAPGGLRRVVEAYVARVVSDPGEESGGEGEPGEGEPDDDAPPGGSPAVGPGLRILSWREVR